MNITVDLAGWTLGASRANELALGHLPELWAEASGHRPRTDLSDNLAVQMGSALETFHVGWFAKQTGIFVGGEQTVSRLAHAGLHATLDGIVILPETGRATAWEGKTTGSHTKLDTIKSRYHAQLAIQAAAFGGPPEVVLSVLWRTPEWHAVVVTPDPDLTAELIERAAILRHHVITGTMPPMLPPARVTMPPHRALRFPTTRQENA